MKTVGQFADQPLINVTFDIPDLAAGGRKSVVQPVHRGTTGVVFEEQHHRAGLSGGNRVRGIIDGWEGDKPDTRIEVLPL